VTVRCNRSRTARGAVVIYPHDFSKDAVNDGVPGGSYGGADLTGKPHQAVTLQILLSRKTIALLARKHSLRVDVLIELDTRPVVQANSRVNLPMFPVAG
jgi:hypothetical protein